jgi:endonuclease YncB( thermonuclease family)
MPVLFRALVSILIALAVPPKVVLVRMALPLGVPSSAERATVTGHIDGDKIKVSRNRKGEELLLSGIDTPETWECHATEAADRDKELLPKSTKV